MKPVEYFGSSEPVMLGDIVTTRVFFVRRKARVVYVPGISQKRASLEHHGLSWVGLQELRGTYLAALVDPNTWKLDRKVKLVERSDPIEIASAQDPFIEQGELIGRP